MTTINIGERRKKLLKQYCKLYGAIDVAKI
jgi:hypothetical protein